MPKVRSKYIASSTLIDGVPNLQDIAALDTPVTDRILFYDTAAESWDYLEIGTNLAIESSTLDGTGASAADAIAFAIALG